jgi:hypothetical protein
MSGLAASAPSATNQYVAPLTVSAIPGSSASSPLVIQVVGMSAPVGQSPHWTAYWTAISTPIVALAVAVIAALIAYRQWKTATVAAETAKNKLKLDLFERRFAVFSAAAQLIVKMHRDDDPDDEKIFAMFPKMAGAEFLFDDAVNAYLLEELFKHTAKVMSLKHALLDARASGDQILIDKLAADQLAERAWFDLQLDELKRLTRPFLELAH